MRSFRLPSTRSLRQCAAVIHKPQRIRRYSANWGILKPSPCSHQAASGSAAPKGRLKAGGIKLYRARATQARCAFASGLGEKASKHNNQNAAGKVVITSPSSHWNSGSATRLSRKAAAAISTQRKTLPTSRCLKSRRTTRNTTARQPRLKPVSSCMLTQSFLVLVERQNSTKHARESFRASGKTVGLSFYVASGWYGIEGRFGQAARCEPITVCVVNTPWLPGAHYSLSTRSYQAWCCQRTARWPWSGLMSGFSLKRKYGSNLEPWRVR